MKSKIQLTIIIGIFLVALISVNAGPLNHPVLGMSGMSSVASDNNGSYALNQDKELEEFYSAKNHIHNSNYSAALTGFEKFLDKFPSSRLHDEAYYWSAYALNILSRAQDHTYVMAKLKEQAFDYLNRLIEEHPTSNWVDDAKVMRLEIAGELILMGKDSYLQYIEDTLSIKKDWSSDLKLHALDSLMRVRKEAAMPILLKLVDDEKNPEVREKAVFLLGKHYDQEVIDILKNVAEHDKSENVRKEAALWLDQIGMKLMPVRLYAYVFGGRLKEGCQLKQVPENRLTTFSLPPSTTRAKEEMIRIIEAFFDNEVDVDPADQLKVSINIDINTDRQRLKLPSSIDGTPLQDFVSFVENGFMVRVLNREVVKDPDRISGKVLFQDMKNDKKHYSAFTVDSKSDQLIAIRRGNDMAMVVIQFESTGKLIEIHIITKKSTADVPIYRTVFTNVYGTRTKVYSSRGTWPGKEMSLSADTTDFGQARTEIPGQGGMWILEGYIYFHKKEMNFFARLATLVDPEGNTVARAEEIVVPIKKPEDYKVTKEKMND